VNSSSQLAYYTFFVVHITALTCIAAVYLYAYRFLNDRFYIPLAIGWLVNAAYLAVETYLFIVLPDAKALRPALLTAALGLTSIPFFHWAVLMRSKAGAKPSHRPFLIGVLPIAICVAGGFWAKELVNSYPSHWIFAIFLIPAASYSACVFMAVAHRFFLLFPEEDYGRFSSLLYGSWALYAILQAFYPFKLFPGINDFFLLLFVFAFGLKVVSSIALLSVLREYYREASAELHEASVLADLGNLAAGLHHDLATPIGRIDSEISLLAQSRHGDRIVIQALDNIKKPLSLMHSAIRFVDLMRQDPDQAEQSFRRVNALEPIEFAMGLFKKRFQQSGFRIVPPPPRQSNYYIRANKELLAEAFLNIFKNALEASARVLRISIRKSRTKDGWIEFLFANDGRPITDEEKKLAFKAGWSTKQKSDGTANIGMGLYMCSRIVGMHGGKVTLYNDNETNFVVAAVTLPARKSLNQP
jgi:two-component system sensor histidine kinase KdpD